VTKKITLQNIVSQAVADKRAKTELEKRSGRYQKIDLEVLTDPRRGPLEAVTLNLPRPDGKMVIEGDFRTNNFKFDLSDPPGNMVFELARTERIS
jgi:hypothetical protein